MPNAPVTPIADTLQCDTALLQQLQQASAYDYHREFIQSERSIVEAIVEYLNQWFDNTLQTAAAPDARPYWIIGAVVVLIAAGIYLYTHDVGLFKRKGKAELDYEVDDEDIYDIDFDERIIQAVRLNDWREATRLTHLKMLRWLADSGRIEWAIYKTPTQYTREEPSSEFRDMTNVFMRVRYGNFEATEHTYHHMQALAQAIVERSTSEMAQDHEQQKGGES